MTHAAEQFWAGPFGTEYHARNVGRVDANKTFFYKVLACMPAPRRDMNSVMEFGCGTGENLAALREVAPWATRAGVELHVGAAGQAQQHGIITLGSFLTEPVPECDLVFTKGVLIHVPPEKLQAAYRKLVASSHRYVLVAEYHNPTPVEVSYRGHEGRLWKRDFAAEILDHFRVKVLDYGFVWSRDAQPQDDLVWTLFEKE